LKTSHSWQARKFSKF